MVTRRIEDLPGAGMRNRLAALARALTSDPHARAVIDKWCGVVSAAGEQSASGPGGTARALGRPATRPVSVTSFGYLHGPPPEAHVVLDLRAHFRDPHVDPRLRHLTARDAAVRDAVMATPGIPALVDAVVSAVAAYQAGPGGGPVAVAVGCAGGRHRAATVATVLGARLGAAVAHRDLHRAVVATADRLPGARDTSP